MTVLAFNEPDKDWMAFKNGDAKAYERIYNQYSTILIRYGIKICADALLVEDCLQDLFIELWHQRANLAEVREVKLYLINAMRYKILATQKRKMVPKDIYVYNQINAEDDINAQEIRISKEADLSLILEKLPKRQKEVIYLHYYLGCSIKQIAQTLQINYQSVANSLHRAILSLRKNSLQVSVGLAVVLTQLAYLIFYK